ncbi:MAG: phosphotransferase [Anaerolineaceae bacterium]
MAYYRCMEHAEISAALLADLRSLLGRPALAYLDPPVPLTGGYDTAIFAFQLKGAPPDFSGGLVLRLFGENAARRARFEGVAQTAVADLGYPAPRALHVSESGGQLGRAYLVMPRIDGKQLIAVGILRFGALLAGAQVALHALDPVPVRLALEAADCGPIAAGIDDWLKTLDAEVAQPGLEGLRPAYEWLANNRPRRPARAVICHLDFHPLNVLAENGAVTGVVDWAGMSFGDPAADVGVTRVILTLAPFEAPRLLKPVAQQVRRLLAWRYTSAYRKLRPLSADAVRYYEALRCFEAMSHLSRMRLAERGGSPVTSTGYAWSDPATVRRLTRHFLRITGVELGVLA